ncbi:MAG: lactate racemase domain-containing protein [Verrucomicrobia bacterium]|nr:lactate racemase domain-containing protein [Verrucomicrobiota bacterium]MDA1087714.1 lactate racemase domain-containing protein [Verrucomicrobiota bacterium]
MTTTATAIGIGYTDRLLSDGEIGSVLDDAFADWDLDNKRVLILIPDGTRSCPLDVIFPMVYERLADRVDLLDFMIALGTHTPMSEAQIYDRVGIDAAAHQSQYQKAKFFNHAWDDPEALTQVGIFTKTDIEELTEGAFNQELVVTCNRKILDYDLLLICGPVFPHEIAGFSGGNKYIFPGISGSAAIDFSHWLAALATNYETIGRKDTPARRVIDRCASLLKIDRRALCMVEKQGGLAGLFAGIVEEAWSDAVDLSAQVHIEHYDHPFHTVFACCPPMYDDLWTGAKAMYKSEPVVAEGGRVIIYAPHITQISKVHGKTIEAVGFHVRDYFVKQWDRFKHYPWSELTFVTGVAGRGTYEDGVETKRVEVILATGISEDVCRRTNISYMDPASINPADYQGREDEGILYIPKAGERLYRQREK